MINKLPRKKHGGKAISIPKMGEETKINIKYSIKSLISSPGFVSISDFLTSVTGMSPSWVFATSEFPPMLFL